VDPNRAGLSELLARLDSDPGFLEALVDDAPGTLRGYGLTDRDVTALLAYLRGRSAAITDPRHRRLQAAATFLILARLGYPLANPGDRRGD
jgi:hypothetical protein